MLKKLIEKRGSLSAQITEMRKALDGKVATAEEKRNWDQLLADYTANEAAIEAEQRRADEDKARARQGAENSDKEQRADRERQIFRDILLRGNLAKADLTPEERASITGTPSTYLMPTTIADKVEVALLAAGGMMQAAEIIRTAKGETLNLPTLNDTSRKATIIAAYNDGAGRSSLSFGNVALGAFTYRTALIPLSYELLQDSYFDIEKIVVDALAESFARAMNEHFTTAAADATTTPKGIVAAAHAVNGANAGAIKADDMLSLMAGVNAAYWPKAKWMFNAATLVEIMKLKDQEGRFIWQPDMANGARATIFGHEYVLNYDMDNVAATKKPILFGDFSKYKIRIVRGIEYRRLEELLAEYASIGIFGFCRADGALVDAGTHPVASLVIPGSGSGSAAGSGSGSGNSI